VFNKVTKEGATLIKDKLIYVIGGGQCTEVSTLYNQPNKMPPTLTHTYSYYSSMTRESVCVNKPTYYSYRVFPQSV